MTDNLLAGQPPHKARRRPDPLTQYARTRGALQAAFGCLQQQSQGGLDSIWRGERHHLTAAGWRKVLRVAQAAGKTYRAGFGPQGVADAAARELTEADWLVRESTRALFAGLAAKGQLAVDLAALERALAAYDRFREEVVHYRSPRPARRRVARQPQREPLPVEAARAVPVTEVVQRYGIELRRAGKELIGRCPFHADQRPSLRVDPARGLWHCFPCDIGGDVIAFVQRLRGLEFAAAVREVVA